LRLQTQRRHQAQRQGQAERQGSQTGQRCHGLGARDRMMGD
jgi:hypothetical protein